MAEFYTFQDLFTEQLNDLYGTEELILRTMPQILAHTSSEELRESFSLYMKEVAKHSINLTKIFEMNSLPVRMNKLSSKAIEGMLEEAVLAMDHGDDSCVKDASFIAIMQRFMHYKMAMYGTARTFARHLNDNEAMNMLQLALNEEAEADKMLTKIAEGGIFTTGINEEACKISLHA